MIYEEKEFNPVMPNPKVFAEDLTCMRQNHLGPFNGPFIFAARTGLDIPDVSYYVVVFGINIQHDVLPLQ